MESTETVKSRRAPKARKDASHQEKVILTSVVKEHIDKLLTLHSKAATASEDFSSAIKATAEKSGINAAALRKFVAARAGENFEDRKRDCEQLSLLFDEVGE